MQYTGAKILLISSGPHKPPKSEKPPTPERRGLCSTSYTNHIDHHILRAVFGEDESVAAKFKGEHCRMLQCRNLLKESS